MLVQQMSGPAAEEIHILGKEVHGHLVCKSTVIFPLETLILSGVH